MDLGVPEHVGVLTSHLVSAAGGIGLRVTVERDARILADHHG
ncbi:hypothetical protein [Streptomyces sp. NPDC001268]